MTLTIAWCVLRSRTLFFSAFKSCNTSKSCTQNSTICTLKRSSSDVSAAHTCGELQAYQEDASTVAHFQCFLPSCALLSATLNLVLNGTWQPMSLNRLHLERLMSSTSNGAPCADAAAVGSKGPSSSKPSVAATAATTAPLNLQHIVSQWNDSLEKMQRTLTQYLQARTCDAGRLETTDSEQI